MVFSSRECERECCILAIYTQTLLTTWTWARSSRTAAELKTEVLWLELGLGL